MDANRQVTHFSTGRGFAETACGKNLHGWNMNRPQNVTDVVRETTCKRCNQKLAS